MTRQAELPGGDVASVILAAGQGSRIQSLTKGIPKQLLRVGEETLVSRLIRQLYENGVSRHYVSYQGHTRQVRTALEALDGIYGSVGFLQSRPSKGENFAELVRMAHFNRTAIVVVMADNAFRDGDIGHFMQNSCRFKLGRNIVIATTNFSVSESGKYYNTRSRTISRIKRDVGDKHYTGLAYFSSDCAGDLIKMNNTKMLPSITEQINRIARLGCVLNTFEVSLWFDINIAESYDRLQEYVERGIL